jgi:hypothetical protein
VACPVRRTAALITGAVVGLTACASNAEVTLPPEASLPEGSYDAVVSGPGGQLQTRLVVGPAESGSAVAVVLVCAALIGLVALAYFGVLLPRRRRQAYGQALAQMDVGEFRRALPALTRLEGRLPARLRAEARFHIAFALFQLDSLDEAEHRLAALHRENPADPSVLHLLAHLLVTRRDHEGCGVRSGQGDGRGPADRTAAAQALRRREVPARRRGRVGRPARRRRRALREGRAAR